MLQIEQVNYNSDDPLALALYSLCFGSASQALFASVIGVGGICCDCISSRSLRFHFII